MTYSEGLIKGIISIVGLGLLWFLIIKPFAIGYSKNVEEKEKKREEMRDLKLTLSMMK